MFLTDALYEHPLRLERAVSSWCNWSQVSSDSGNCSNWSLIFATEHSTSTFMILSYDSNAHNMQFVPSYVYCKRDAVSGYPGVCVNVVSGYPGVCVSFVSAVTAHKPIKERYFTSAVIWFVAPVTYPGVCVSLCQCCVTDRNLNYCRRTNHNALFHNCCYMIRSRITYHVFWLSSRMSGLYTSRAFCIISENTTSYSPWSTTGRPKPSRHCKRQT